MDKLNTLSSIFFFHYVLIFNLKNLNIIFSASKYISKIYNLYTKYNMFYIFRIYLENKLKIEKNFIFSEFYFSILFNNLDNYIRKKKKYVINFT